MSDLANEIEADALLSALKALLKERRVSYAQIADQLEVSLPTVKRMLNKASLPLDRLLAVCKLSGIELSAVMNRVETERPRHTILNEEQDSFLAERPEFLTYLLCLVEKGMTPLEIEGESGISRRSSEAYLRELERMKLLEREPELRVRLKVSAPLGFGPGSKVLGAMQAAFVSSVVEKVAAGDRGGCFALIKPLMLDEALYGEMLEEFQTTVNKFSYLSSQLTRREVEAPLWSVVVASAPGAIDKGTEIVDLA